MSIGGDTSLWSDLVPDCFIPQIIALVLEGWDTFEQPGRADLEVPLTRRFCCFLRGRKNQSRELPFSIWWESEELDTVTGREVGRVDLRFSHGYREDVYFAFECKRLNVKNKAGRRRSLAAEYVQDGMMRFVEGKYARRLDKGGMLGYVMDGDVSGAIASVGNAVRQRRADLKMKNGGMGPSSVRPSDARVGETRHFLDSGRFVLHHVLVAVG